MTESRSERLVIVRTANGGVMEVRVDPALCEANGRCVSIAPEVFSLDDDEILHIAAFGDAVDDARITRAVAACPLSALSVHDVDRPAPRS